METTDKPYKLTVEERSGYLFFHLVAPELTESIALDYVHDIARMCSDLGYSKMMILRDIPHVFPVGSFFNVSRLTKQLFQDLQVAWVNPYPENHSAMDFATTVANNRGALYRLFTVEDQGEAEKWLIC